MRLTLWDEPPADCLQQAGLALGHQVVRQNGQQCVSDLLAGRADVALWPTVVALVSSDAVALMPTTAVSCWTYPFARLVLKREMQAITSVAYPEGSVQESILARIILQEHYGAAAVELVPKAPFELRENNEDACLLLGPPQSGEEPPGTVLDIGQEWVELAQYPYVWGVFVTRKDRKDAKHADELEALVSKAEQLAADWPAFPDFYASSLRLRLDDMALASLTRLREYLYYYGLTKELDPLPIAEWDEMNSAEPWWTGASFDN